MQTEGVVLHPDNPGFRFGDGLFETMRVAEGKIRLWDYHRERLEEGMKQLAYEMPSGFAQRLKEDVITLCEAEQCSGAARVRVNVFRGTGALYGTGLTPCHYLVRAMPLDASVQTFCEAGIRVGVFRGAVRCPDEFSRFKTQNYLASVMAARYAAGQGWDDALLVNGAGRIVESAIANVFWVTGDGVKTPPLSEGCVAGVMRRQLLKRLPEAGIPVAEAPVSLAGLEAAKEIFLTNALKTVVPVTTLGDRHYPVTMARRIFSLAGG